MELSNHASGSYVAGWSCDLCYHRAAPKTSRWHCCDGQHDVCHGCLAKPVKAPAGEANTVLRAEGKPSTTRPPGAAKPSWADIHEEDAESMPDDSEPTNGSSSSCDIVEDDSRPGSKRQAAKRQAAKRLRQTRQLFDSLDPEGIGYIRKAALYDALLRAAKEAGGHVKRKDLRRHVAAANLAQRDDLDLGDFIKLLEHMVPAAESAMPPKSL
jgi:hypothetical protein